MEKYNNNILNKTLHNLLSNPFEENIQKAKTIICDEVIDALKGQNTARFEIKNRKIKYIFKLRYHETYAKDKLPDYIEFFDNQKEFVEALSELCLYLFEKWDMTIQNALTFNKLEWKKWIRSTFSIVLTNRVFSYEIKQYRRKHTDIPYLEQINKQEDYSETCPVNNLQTQAFINTEFFEERSQINCIESQKNAFFWMPGKPCKNKIIYNKKPMTIAYFFRWLRICSGAITEEIAKEVKVDITSVARWKMNTDECFQKLFPEKNNYLLSPVYFSHESRKIIGMYNRYIRSFQGDISHKLYPTITSKKEMIWGIYEFIELNLIEQIKISIFDETNFFQEEFEVIQKGIETGNYKITFKIIFPTEINMQKKLPDALMYVSSISKI